jgi:predicted transcriptional regulator YheO
VGGMAMSVQGFVRTYDQMTQVINKLVEQGVLKKRDAIEAPQETPKA